MDRLKKSTLFYYSLTDLPIAMSLFPVAVFVPRFYASEMGVPLAVIGTILFVVRIFDVITDPLMGYISDHTRSRFGRRRPWVFAATPIMMLSIYMLFMPPEGAGWVHMFVWSLLLSIAMALTLIYEICSIERFPRVQNFLSYARLVKGDRSSDGKKKAGGGRKMGNQHLKWAFSEAAALFLRDNPEGKRLRQRLERKHGKAKAMSVLAAKLGRAVYYMLRRHQPFDFQRFVNAY